MDKISKILRVKYAFLGCSLEKGSRIIAIGHIVFFTTFFLITGFIYYGPRAEKNETHLEENSTLNGSDFYDESDDNKDHYTNLTRSYFLEFVMFTQIIFAISLLHGIKHKLPDYLISWVLMQAAHSLFSQFFIVVYIVAFILGHSYYIQYLIIDEITMTVIELYFIAVVLSYYNQLIKETQDEYLSPIVHRNSVDDNMSPIIISS